MSYFSDARDQHALLDSLPLQVWTARPDGELDFVNRFTCAYFGLSREELVGTGWQNVLHAADVPAILAQWTHSLATGEPYCVTFRLQRAGDGAFRWHEGRAEALRNAAGEITCWVGANTDVDDATRAQEGVTAARERLRVEQSRVRSLFDQFPTAILVLTGPDHCIEQINHQARSLFGPSAVEGVRMREALPGPDHARFHSLLDAVYTSGSARRSPGPAAAPGISPTPASFLLQPLRDAAGEICGVLALDTAGLATAASAASP